MKRNTVLSVVLGSTLSLVACSPSSADDGSNLNDQLSENDRNDGDSPAGTELDAAISEVNAKIDREKLPLKKLTRSEFLEWVDDFAPFELMPKERALLQGGLRRGVLAAPFGLQVEVRDQDGLEPQIVLSPENETIIEGGALKLHTAVAAERACQEPHTCVETFQGSLPPQTAASFPTSVELRIRETKAPGTCLVPDACDGDTLSIELHLTEANIEDAVAYFAHGFGAEAVRGRAKAALQTATDGWVRLEALLPNWVGEKANTYPVDGDNEVCHGPARQFFQPQLMNGSMDRSTEATAVVLKNHYCRVPDDGAPGFGDYLYIAGAHSGRFVLVDPKTQRWISFSVQSGGFAAYRFWWADEDFSGKPFAHTPLPDFRKQLVDVWRRCR